MKKINESQLEKMISEIIKRTLKEDVYTPDNFYDEKKSFKQYAKDAKMPSNYDKGFNRNYNAGNDSEVDTADRALTLNKKDYETPEMKRAEKESDWANLEHQVDNFKSKAGKNASQYIDRHDDYFSKFNPNTDRDASKYSGMFDDEYWKGVNESKKQTKQTIRLTESQFNEVITKTIKKVLREDMGYPMTHAQQEREDEISTQFDRYYDNDNDDDNYDVYRGYKITNKTQIKIIDDLLDVKIEDLLYKLNSLLNFKKTMRLFGVADFIDLPSTRKAISRVKWYVESYKPENRENRFNKLIDEYNWSLPNMTKAYELIKQYYNNLLILNRENDYFFSLAVEYPEYDPS